MKTQQAVSPRRGSVLPSRDSRAGPRAIPAVWLNLVCLDAPLVAVAWLWLFARTFQVPLHIGNCLALFLTAWLIYLADRLADALSLKAGAPRSLRQDFCVRHREIWIALVVLVAAFDVYVIWRTTALATLLVGAVVGALALIYLVMNHPLGLIWRSLPAKEVAIGVLFAAGMLVALMPSVPFLHAPFVISAIAFAALCALNCISIAGWERELDRAQGKVSAATRHPNFTRRAEVICLGLALACLALAIVYPSAALILGCLSVSALLLGYLNASATTSDQLTALADLVLLTPLIAIILAAL